MQHSLLVVSYYTAATSYATDAMRLQRSLRHFSLAHDIRKVAHYGSWQLNTHYKAQFLRLMQLAYPGRHLLFLDADAIVRRMPVPLEQIAADIAVHFRHQFRARDPEVLSGTIYLAPTTNARRVVDHWIRLNAANPDALEQQNLQDAIALQQHLQTYRLPPEYAFIFDSMRREFPDANPVIEHFQASRRYRQEVNSLPVPGGTVGDLMVSSLTKG